jgi:hypothetical protein
MTISHNVPQTIIGIQILGTPGYAFGLATQPTVPALETMVRLLASASAGPRGTLPLESVWVQSVARGRARHCAQAEVKR